MENRTDPRIERVFSQLARFQKEHQVVSKGPLATVLFISRRAREGGLPIEVASLRTTQQGQVAGLGREPVQKILADHGITKVLAEEGGRTSRGSLGRAETYARLLNVLYKAGKLKPEDMPLVEEWWVDRVTEHFNRQCFKIDLDPAHSVSTVVSMILDEARKRQQAAPGSMIEGSVLQHLVGAKLALVLPEEKLEFHGSSVADEATSRAGDIQVRDSVIHVTVSPSERVVAKCKENLGSGLRPIIVCPKGKVAGAKLLTENAGVQDRVEIYDVETFVSTNVNELAGFRGEKVKDATGSLIRKYNEIVSEVEKDPSLQIEEK